MKKIIVIGFIGNPSVGAATAAMNLALKHPVRIQNQLSTNKNKSHENEGTPAEHQIQEGASANEQETEYWS